MSANERLSNSPKSCWSTAATLIPLEEVPGALRATVCLESSVTAAIAQRFGSPPEVLLELEDIEQALPWENELLGLEATPCRVRHVSLSVRGRCLVQARSIAAAADEGGELLRTLGTRPLGGLLFETETWSREGPVHPARVEVEGALRYGRASLWRHSDGDGRLLVAEYFAAPLSA